MVTRHSIAHFLAQFGTELAVIGFFVILLILALLAAKSAEKG